MAEHRQLVIGIGASAGGVEALQAFFRAMPQSQGLSFIVVMHLGEGRESMMPDILSRCTRLPVAPARNNARIEPNHLYVLASDALLTVKNGRLNLRQHRSPARERHPIDVFFASLAEDAGENAVAIILSGAGSDGTLGAKAIKERGGLTIAQQSDDGSPRHPEMPTSAVAAGAIDLDIPIEAMGAKLLEYADGVGRLELDGQPRARRQDIDRARQTICDILLDHVGHNFTGYKERTMLRRIERRMQVLDLRDINRYIARLRDDHDEVIQLFRDLLIGVTAFFRDKEAFDALSEKVLPQLFAGKGAADTIRIWVPGCSTGEEVYSLAILLLEHMAGLKTRPTVQCFATDIDDAAIAVARAATYPAAMLRDVGPERLDRYFTGDGVIFTLTKEVRDMCIFSSHSVIRDPPFSRIDLISCRNLLIYLDTDLQTQLVPVFHYALRPGGYLFLGSSENLTRHAELFAPVDKRHRIFQRRDSATNLSGFSLVMPGIRSAQGQQRSLVRTIDGMPLRQSVERQVLERFAPAHVVVNRAGDIVHYSARTGKYLENAAGTPTRQVVAMARRGLRLDLRSALNDAIETRRPQQRSGLSIELDDSVQNVDIAIEPLPELDGEPLFLIVFTDVGALHGAEEVENRTEARERADVDHLEHELRDTRERLQSMVEEYETALEELKSANEELVSTNEELQSTNEELETSREETQSINEELNTVNSELHRKVEELDRTNDDLRNLFESTPIGTVFLNRHKVIRTFTPAITAIFNLIAGDRGRPLTDIANDLEGVDLRGEIDAVLRTRQGRERRVVRRGGKAHYLMRILPDNTASADGGVLASFIDISPMVEFEQHLREFNEGADTMLQMVLQIADATLLHATNGNETEAGMNRLRSLGAIYKLLSRVEWNAVALRDLVTEELGDLGRAIAARVALSGPPIALKPKTAIVLGLALHELIANARRHGALSGAHGRVAIGWSVETADSAEPQLVIQWRESDGPPVERPGTSGFGRTILERQLPAELGAEAGIEFAPDGVAAQIAVPLNGNLVVAEP